ncbi:hypothetical protein ACOMHN_053259 [Nucella lapillus]
MHRGMIEQRNKGWACPDGEMPYSQRHEAATFCTGFLYTGGPHQAPVGESEIHPKHHERRQSNTTDGSPHQERNRDQTKQLSASHASSQQLITNSAHSAAPQGYLWTKSIH